MGMLQSWLFTFSVYVTVGNVFVVLAHLRPVRKDVGSKRELLVDALAVLWSNLLEYGFWTFLGYRLLAIRSLPGMEWLRDARLWLGTFSPVVGGIVFFVFADFLAYWTHRLNHTRLFWSTHAFHHSATQLDWAAGLRESPVHKILFASPRAIAGLLAPVVGPVSTFAIVHAIAHNSFIHSNLRIETRWLKWLFVTGESHFVHHAKDVRLGNSNFGFVLTVWDRMFGTWVDPATVPKEFPLGIDEEVSLPRLFLGLPPPKRATAEVGWRPTADDDGRVER